MELDVGEEDGMAIWLTTVIFCLVFIHNALLTWLSYHSQLVCKVCRNVLNVDSLKLDPTMIYAKMIP